jgi:hypothetical protein
MVDLSQDAKGNYRARKRIPDDVRDEYGRLYGQSHEAKFFRPASTSTHEAKQQFRDWLNEVEGNIEAIRAARRGTGRSLTRQQARALAGEWYEWWTSRHPDASHQQLEHWRDAVHDAIYFSEQQREAITTSPGRRRVSCTRGPAPAGIIEGYRIVSEEDAERFEPDELWRDRADVRESVRPVLADIGETSQFLAAKRLALTSDARDLFLDFLYEDLAAALKRLERLAEGDYSTDTYTERFPTPGHAGDTGVTPWQRIVSQGWQKLYNDWATTHCSRRIWGDQPGGKP